MKIEVMENESGAITVLGTHDEDTALNAVMDFYMNVVGLDFDEVKELDLSRSEAFWLDPVVMTQDFYPIPEMFISKTHKTAWIPTLFKKGVR